MTFSLGGQSAAAYANSSQIDIRQEMQIDIKVVGYLQLAKQTIFVGCKGRRA